jgi:hypothetical protein
MTRPLLSVLGAALLCAHSLVVMSAEQATSVTATSGQAVRQAVEAKRDQASGVSQVAPARATGPAKVLDVPVATDDAPAQAEQP